jgi:hypothetical protein
MFWVAAGGERLAVTNGGEARMTGGGDIGTPRAIAGGGGEPLAVGRGDKAPGLAGLLHH